MSESALPELRGAEWPPNARPPVFLTELVGRSDEIERVAALLQGARLVSLVGPGGSGKTRMAVAVVETWARERGRGGAWIDLQPVCDPGVVARHAASTLGLREHPSRTPEQALIERIGDTEPLLVLDNCEHVVRPCARLVDSLLRECPGVRILTTSREPLGLNGEKAWKVPPLALPARDDGDARTAPAVELFVQRARDALPSFSLDDANLPAVARICRRLDGLPLAIELAAARVPVLPPGQLADRLDDMLQILGSRSWNSMPRHRTLRALIDWSYDLLSPSERSLLDRLAVFVGGFTLDAAERVAAEAVDEDVLDLLAALVDKSLVFMRESHGEARYSLLETVRQYARQRLLASDGSDANDALHLAHARYFAELVERLSGEARTGGPAYWSKIEAEHDNVRAALPWALAHDQPELALRICVAMREFWRVRGYLREGLGWTRQACEAARPEPRREGLRAAALVAAAVHGRMMGEYLALQGWLAEAESIARAACHPSLLADALTQLGLSLRDRGELDIARERLDEALSLWRETGDARGLSSALGARASLALAEGDTALARTLRLEASEVSHVAGDREAEAHALIGLGEVARMDGDLEEARSCNHRCLRLFDALGDRWHAAAACHNLGWIEMQAGRDGESLTAFARCVDLFRSSGNPFGLTLCLFGFARLLFRAGDAEAAALALATAEIHAARVGVRPAAPADVIACEETAAGIAAALSPEVRGRATAGAGTTSLADALTWAERRLAELLQPSPDEAAGTVRVASDPAASDQRAESGAEAGGAEPRAAPPPPDLRVLALGPLGIFVDGGGEQVDAFGSSRPRELLLMMLCHPEGVSREQVGMAFWPDASSSQVKNNFHVMMHRLRKGLGHSEWVVTDGDRYRLDPGLRIDFDAARFEHEARAALRDFRSGADVEERLARALELYRGELLEGTNAGDWHLDIRDRLRLLHADALIARAELLRRGGRLDEAAEAYHAVLARDRLHEEALRGLMTCRARTGQRAQALKLYERFSLLLQEELGAGPDPSTTGLYERLQRSEPL